MHLTSTCLSRQAALEAVTASQQLVPAIFALAMCARPLLAAGLPPPPGADVMEADAANGDADAAAEHKVDCAISSFG